MDQPGAASGPSAPAYSGGFYKRGTDGKAGTLGGPGQPSVAGGAGGLASGAIDAVEGAASNESATSDSGTAAQSGPDPSYAAVPGPGFAVGLVLVAALVLILARRRIA